MFHFVVRHVHCLSRVPGAAQIFDALLLMWTAIFHSSRLRAMESLEAAALQIPGVERSVHRFGGLGFIQGNREFAHLHGNGLLDVHLSRERAGALVAAGRAQTHHVLGPSAWVSFQLHSPADLEAAGQLIAEAIE